MKRLMAFFLKKAFVIAFLQLLMLMNVEAATPVWSFTPQTPTNITLSKGSSAKVIYVVQNHSLKAKTLFMRTITGISQGPLCQLAPKGSCALTLTINGSALRGDVVGGPVLCEQTNANQCYQPSAKNSLRIKLTSTPIQYTITPVAGANGSISPSTVQFVSPGASLVFTATPASGFEVDRWRLDGNIIQNGQTQYQLTNIQANHAVQVSFKPSIAKP